ncbi:tetratricopeptide repeat protein [Gordonia aichiensis]
MLLFRLTSSLAGLLRLDGPWEQAARLHSRVAEYARTGGDQLAYGNALNDLAVVRDLTGAHAEARDLLTEALETYRRIEHRTGAADAASPDACAASAGSVAAVDFLVPPASVRAWRGGMARRRTSARVPA